MNYYEASRNLQALTPPSFAMVLGLQYGSACSRMSIPVLATDFFPPLLQSLSFWQLLGGLTTTRLPAYSTLPQTYGGFSMFWSKPKCKGAAEATKHPTTTTTSTANIISSALLDTVGRNDPPLRLSTMTNGQTNKCTFSQFFVTQAMRGCRTGFLCGPG